MFSRSLDEATVVHDDKETYRGKAKRCINHTAYEMFYVFMICFMLGFCMCSN